MTVISASCIWFFRYRPTGEDTGNRSRRSHILGTWVVRTATLHHGELQRVQPFIPTKHYNTMRNWKVPLNPKWFCTFRTGLINSHGTAGVRSQQNFLNALRTVWSEAMISQLGAFGLPTPGTSTSMGFADDGGSVTCCPVVAVGCGTFGKNSFGYNSRRHEMDTYLSNKKCAVHNQKNFFGMKLKQKWESYLWSCFICLACPESSCHCESS